MAVGVTLRALGREEIERIKALMEPLKEEKTRLQAKKDEMTARIVQINAQLDEYDAIKTEILNDIQ
jgi:uncharacterized protein YlxW (UPF0749 family)